VSRIGRISDMLHSSTNSRGSLFLVSSSMLVAMLRVMVMHVVIHEFRVDLLRPREMVVYIGKRRRGVAMAGA
jgi:hypothetical protein